MRIFQTFAGEYRDVVGTALFFEEDPSPTGSDPVFTTIPKHQLRYVCKTRKALCMSRVFLKRKDSVQEDSGVDPNVDTGENSVGKTQETGPKNVHVSSPDSLTMDIEEPPAKDKEETSRHSEPEPAAGPSWMPDIPDDDVRDLQMLMEAAVSKYMTHEVSRLVEKHIKSTSDNFENSAADSDTISDD
jgi:hypothetical protein